MNTVKDFVWRHLSFPANPVQVQALRKVFDRELLIYALKCTYGNKLKAAEILDMNRMTLHKMCKNLGVSARDFKDI